MIVTLALLGHQTLHLRNKLFFSSYTIYYYGSAILERSATEEKKVYFASVKFDARAKRG